MLKKAEEIYRRIFSIVPAGCSRFERFDEDRNKRILFNRSPDWISLYYFKHERAPKLNEGYQLKDEKGVFQADLFQGWGSDNKTHWESIDNHPEFHQSFERILDWAISVVPEEVAKFLAAQKEEEKKQKKSLDKLTASLKGLDFRDVKAFLELIVPKALAQDAAFLSKFEEAFSDPESFLDDWDNNYKLERFFSSAMTKLVEQRCAVWVDWKDVETLDFQLKHLLDMYSLPMPESLFAVPTDDVAARIQRLTDSLRGSTYRVTEIDTGGDEYLFFLAKAEGASGLKQALMKLKELKLMPKEFTLKSEKR